MKVYIILIWVIISLLLLLACNNNQRSIGQSFISNTRENELNHFKLDFTMSNTISGSFKTINFTSDTILLQLKVVGMEGKGTGEVHLYRGDSTTVKAYNFNSDILLSDTLFTDTLINMPPDKATFAFKKFTGRFIFQMDGK
jgi:hypothetical protein